MVPQFAHDNVWAARWDRFGRPAALPEYSIGFPSIWWFDQTRAENTESTP